MAEYVEVMNQKRRMCNSYALCSMGCPLNNIDFCNKNGGEKICADFPEVERRIMSWAAEHPEPVYPTWYEYLTEIYPAAWELIAHYSIPADIAQKLEIEPKEE